MEINITGKHMDLGKALQEHIQDRLKEGVSKYLDRINNVEVVIVKEGHRFRADIHAHAGTHDGLSVNGRGASEDVYAAFDQAADKIEKQLRRYKRRLTNHHVKQSEVGMKLLPAKKYVLAADGDEEVSEEEKAPVIIAEKPTHIATLTVSQAVMRMDLADVPALMFFNSASGRINIVYRRADGNISWVDPEEVQAAA